MLKTGKMKFLSVIMSMALVFSVMPADYVEAEETTVTGSGVCGAEGNEESVRWSYDSDGTLTISGTGAMADYDGEEGSSPLSEYRNKARKIIIGEGITSIGSYNFYQFNEVEEIEFSKESLKHIGDSAFAANFNLRHITIPESVETLGSAAFSLCEHLEEIRIPGNISRVPEFAFTCNGWGAKNIVLEEGVTEIASHAFASVYLQRLELPDTVTSIASDAFTHYNNCSPVVYGKTEYIKEFAAANDWAYVDVSNAYDIKNADIRISNRYLYTGQEIKPIPEVIYHINEKDIILCPESDYKLEYSNNIECGTASVTITGLGCYTGSKVITYEIFQPTSGAFGTCGAEGNENNVIWLYDGDGTLTISGTGAMADFEESGSPWYKFRNKITKIIIEDGVTSIGAYSFYKFVLVEEIEYPKYSLNHIGEWAFAFNEKLHNVEIPKSVQSIGYDAYVFCSSLENVRISGIIYSISSDMFIGCYNLKSIVLEEGVTVIGERAFADSTGIQKIELPGTITKIAANAFYENSSPIVYGKTEYTREFAFAKDWIYVDASNPYDIKNADVRISSRYLYTGQEIKPIPEIIYHINGQDIMLYPESDYKLEYSNNIECGTASVTITGLGCYTGSKVVTYEIFQPESMEYGTCGAKWNEDNVIWSYDSDGTLTISGTGAMADYGSGEGSPWWKYKFET